MLGPLSLDRQDRLSGRWSAGWPVALAVMLCCLAGSGCYWLKYGKLMRTHVDLLLSMAAKMGDLLEDGRPISTAEFSYPLERAQDFVRIVGARYGEQRSLREFHHFLEMYAELLKEPERLRKYPEGVEGFRTRVAALRQEGQAVKALLTEEGW
jgi:hypothetical protein